MVIKGKDINTSKTMVDNAYRRPVRRGEFVGVVNKDVEAGFGLVGIVDDISDGIITVRFQMGTHGEIGVYKHGDVISILSLGFIAFNSHVEKETSHE